MNPERLEQIDHLFQSALDLAPEQRGAYLKNACVGDMDLRREVESLLKAHDEAGNFIADSASDIPFTLLGQQPMPAGPGQQVGQYRIELRLGSGGMGEVYLATDKLGRKIALKLLPHQVNRDQSRVAR